MGKNCTSCTAVTKRLVGQGEGLLGKFPPTLYAKNALKVAIQFIIKVKL